MQAARLAAKTDNRNSESPGREKDRSAPPPAPWLERAVLIYAPRKSGSTMLHNLLDGGQQLFAYPSELKLKRLAGRNHLSEAEYQACVVLPRNGEENDADTRCDDAAADWTAEAYTRHNLTNIVRRDVFDRSSYDAAWNQGSSQRRSLRDLIRKDVWNVFCNSNQKQKSPDLWCAKEVGGPTPKVIATWRELFPDGKVVLLRRRPLSVIRSILNDRRRKGIRPSLWRIVQQVFQSVRVDQDIRSLAGHSWAVLVTYEDLVRTPAAELQRVCAFLGIELMPGLLVPTRFSEPAVVKTSSKPSKSVFVDTSPWHRGLTLREKAAVALLYPLARLLYGLPFR